MWIGRNPYSQPIFRRVVFSKKYQSYTSHNQKIVNKFTKYIFIIHLYLKSLFKFSQNPNYSFAKLFKYKMNYENIFCLRPIFRRVASKFRS